MTKSCSEAPMGFSASGSSPPRHALDDLRDDADLAGVAHMSDVELLTLVIGPRGRLDPLALAEKLLRQDGLLSLAALHPRQMHQAVGSRSMAATVAAALELGKRVARAKRRERPFITGPDAAAAILGPILAHEPFERLVVLPLNPKCRLIGEPLVVSQGNCDSTDASPSTVFRLLLSAGASSGVLGHQHPGGEPTPSQADIEVTRQCVACGRQLRLPISDHIVIGDGGRWVSIRRREPDVFR